MGASGGSVDAAVDAAARGGRLEPSKRTVQSKSVQQRFHRCPDKGNLQETVRETKGRGIEKHLADHLAGIKIVDEVQHE